MVGRKRLLGIAALVAVIGATQAQTPEPQKAEKPEGTPAADAGKPEGGPRRGGRLMSPEFDNVRRAIEALTPEQQKRFQENFLRWSNLPPEEAKALRERAEVRRKKIQEAINNALAEAGLDLDKEKKQQFYRRYFEERRKVEAQLWKELEEKRKPLMKEIIGKLKDEFSAQQAAATPTPKTPSKPDAASTTPEQQ